MNAHRQAACADRLFFRFGKSDGSSRLLGGGCRLLAVAAFAGIASLANAEEVAGKEGSAGSHPAFLFQSLYADNQGTVFGVYESRQADLVLVKGGFDSGFQTGMHCGVSRGENPVGEIMLVDVRSNCSAALILNLEAGEVIEPGHSVRVKTVKF